MAMDHSARFCHMAGALISIGWALKLNLDASSDFGRRTSHLSTTCSAIDSSSSISPLLQESVVKKYTAQAIFDEVDIYCLLASTKLTIHELNGINWGHWYIKPRSTHWWDQFFGYVLRDDPEIFKEFFRVSISIFHYITELVWVDLEKNPPLGLKNIPNRKLEVTRQVALAIRRLATGDSLSTVGEMFGVANSIASKTVSNFVRSIINCVHHQLSWPTAEGLERVKANFEAKHGIPQVCGAIDCTHIQVNLPSNERATDFFDKDQNYNFTLQAIVDSDTRFLDIFASFLGVVHDARVFSNSGFKASVDRGDRLNGRPRVIGKVPIPKLLIGDAGYTHSTWMLIPIPGYNLASMYDQFNFKHSSTRMCVERSFGILKGVWRILKRTMHTVDVTMVPKMIYCCCILHNIMLDRRDVVHEELPLVGYHDEGGLQFRSRRVIIDEALAIRNAIVEHLWSLEGHSTTSE